MTRRTRSILIGLGIGAVVAALILVGMAVFGGGGGDDVATLDDPEGIVTAQDVSGKAVPGDTFEYFDGSEGSLRDYRGQPLVVNFFAEWCAPCKKELPDFEAVHEQVGDKVTFLGLNTNDLPENGKALAEKAGLTYRLGSDPRGDLLVAMGGVRMPATVFVSADGKILETKLGGLDEAALMNKLREHYPGVVT